MNPSRFMARVLSLGKGAALVALLAIAGCGGGDSSDTAAVESTAAVITPAGGTLVGPDGVTLTVPAGALLANTELRIAKDAAGAPALPEGWTALSSIYLITPHASYFPQQVQVSMAFDISKLPAGGAGNVRIVIGQPGGPWEMLDSTTLSGSQATATTPHFSYVVVVYSGYFETYTREATPQGEFSGVFTQDTVLTLGIERSPRGNFSGYICSNGNGTGYTRLEYFFVFVTRDRNFRQVNFQRLPFGSLDFGESRRQPVLRLTAADNGTVSVTLEAWCGQNRFNHAALVDAFSVDISGPPRPPMIVDQPESVTVIAGESPTFVVNVIAFSPTFDFELSHDDGVTWGALAANRARPNEVQLGPVTLADNDTLVRAKVCNTRAGRGSVQTCIYTENARLTVSSAAVSWQPPTGIAGGGSTSMAITRGGVVWSWGTGNGGVLGHSATLHTPQPVSTLAGVSSVVSGGWYASALLTNGEVYAWGWGEDIGAAIGSPDLDNPVPTRVVGLTNIAAISTRYHHTLAVDATGKLFGFGPEGSGALGPLVGDKGVRQIAGLSDVRRIAAGEAHSLALLADGTVWAWGQNTFGQLGWADPTPQFTPTRVPGLNGVKAIAATSYGSFALLQDGSVWSWGRSDTLGRPLELDVVAKVTMPVPASALAAGNYTVFAVTASGSVYGWGDNFAGRVGVASAAASITSPTILPGLPAVAEVIGGEFHGLALTRDRRVFAWGSNAEFALDGTPRANTDSAIDTGFAP